MKVGDLLFWQKNDFPSSQARSTATLYSTGAITNQSHDHNTEKGGVTDSRYPLRSLVDEFVARDASLNCQYRDASLVWERPSSWLKTQPKADQVIVSSNRLRHNGEIRMFRRNKWKALMAVIAVLCVVQPLLAAVLSIPYYSQRDSRWSSNKLGSCGSTIGSQGCAVTSTAMLLKFRGANVDPAQLNSFLRTECPLRDAGRGLPPACGDSLPAWLWPAFRHTPPWPLLGDWPPWRSRLWA